MGEDQGVIDVKLSILDKEDLMCSIMNCKLCEGYGLKGLCIDQKEIGLKYNYPTEIPINVLFNC
jgi:hypothetical protein